jgi:hypothetical protein
MHIQQRTDPRCQPHLQRDRTRILPTEQMDNEMDERMRELVFENTLPVSLER